MSDAEKPAELVIYLHADRKSGADYIMATPMKVQDGETWPSNLTYGSWEPNPELSRQYADLSLQLFISDFDGRATSQGIEYRSVHSVDALRADLMGKTLKRINKAIQKADAREAGDVLTAFAQAIGAKRFVWHAASEEGRTWLRDVNWFWCSMGEGRNVFRRMIAEAESRHPKNAKAVA